MNKVIFSVLLSLLFFTSCDDHEAVDLGIHSGYILCDDGVVMSDQAFFAQDFSCAFFNEYFRTYLMIFKLLF